MVSVFSSVGCIKYAVVLMYIVLSTTLVNTNPIYYGPPVKVNAQLGVINENQEKLSKDTKSVDSIKSQVIYKPLSPLETDLQNILDSYWNKSHNAYDGTEYTSELPSKLRPIKEHQNSIRESLIKHKTEILKQNLVHNTHVIKKEDDTLSTDRYVENNTGNREFVNRSAIVTKANFSYYHPVHKKYYNITSTEPIQLPKPITMNSNKVSTNENSKIVFHTSHTEENKHKKIPQVQTTQNNKGTFTYKLKPYKTTKVPYKPTGGTYAPITFLPLLPTTTAINHLTSASNFGPHKPLFGHKPSIFDPYNKKSGHRQPHKATHITPQNQLETMQTTLPRPTNKYSPYKPIKPPVHSNISPTGHIPSNNHPPFWSGIISSQSQYKPTKKPTTVLKTTYKPIHVQTPVLEPSEPLESNGLSGSDEDKFYKPTSTTSSNLIVTHKPLVGEFSVQPIYKPTYRPVTESKPQLVIEIPETDEEAIPGQSLLLPVPEETTPYDPSYLPLNSLADVDRLLLMVFEEMEGLYQNLISPFMLEMGNFLFGKSDENPVGLGIIFGLPIMTAFLSAIGSGPFAIAIAAWLFPVLGILFFPQIQ